mmetsp:Transcript_11247/g.12748  ORF Transcript_11247/g.12748 Transcript_11247/m.12748 type:complete len:194 (-) Transcript_11247:1122-1703(-)
MAIGRGDYYGIDDILSEEDQIPVTFNTDAFNLGFLDSTSDSPELGKGAQVELPCWLADILAQRNFVKIKMPKHYTKKYRTYLLADPTVVNLRDKSSFYYDTGIRLCKFFRSSAEASILVSTCLKAFSFRYRSILDRCLSSRNEDNTSYTNMLTHTEQLIFNAGYNSSHEIFKWKNRDDDKLTSFRQKKRKRTH